jgi:hypothetical protein
LSRLKVKDIRRLIVVVQIVVISKLLVVESDLNMCLSKDVAWWSSASDLSGADDCSRNQGKAFKVTEGIIVIGDVRMIVNERIKVVSSKHYFIASIIWTSIRSKSRDGRSVVVPIVYVLNSVLLVVQGH